MVILFQVVHVGSFYGRFGQQAHVNGGRIVLFLLPLLLLNRLSGRF